MDSDSFLQFSPHQTNRQNLSQNNPKRLAYESSAFGSSSSWSLNSWSGNQKPSKNNVFFPTKQRKKKRKNDSIRDFLQIFKVFQSHIYPSPALPLFLLLLLFVSEKEVIQRPHEIPTLSVASFFRAFLPQSSTGRLRPMTPPCANPLAICFTFFSIAFVGFRGWYRGRALL